METSDQFDQIAANILFSDAALALTFTQIASSCSQGENRARAIQYASVAYRHICESICLVRMDPQDLKELATMLKELRAALDDVG